MAIPNDLTVALFIAKVLMGLDPFGDLRFHGLGQEPLGALAQNTRQHVPLAGGWKGNDSLASLSHGGVLRGNVAFKQPNSNPSTPPSSTQLIHNFQLYLVGSYMSVSQVLFDAINAIE